MNKRPELKRFVKFGGAECFENVVVEFQQGKKAILTIFHDGQETEQIELQSMSTAEEMHEMMLEKGFKLKSPEEVARIQKEGHTAFEKEMEGRRKREERARERREKMKSPSAATDRRGSLNAEGVTSTIREALKTMEANGVKNNAETVRMLEQEHNNNRRAIFEENEDSLPDEEQQISKEQTREWKLQQWKKKLEERKLAAASAGDEL